MVFCLANYVDFLVQSTAFLETSPVSLLCPQKSVQELLEESKQWLRKIVLIVFTFRIFTLENGVQLNSSCHLTKSSFKDSSEKMLFMIIWRWQIYALSPTTLRKKCHEKTPYIIDGLVCIYKRSLSHPFVINLDKRVR